MTKSQALKKGAKDLYGDGTLHLEIQPDQWVEIWVPKKVADKRVADQAAWEASRLADQAAWEAANPPPK